MNIKIMNYGYTKLSVSDICKLSLSSFSLKFNEEFYGNNLMVFFIEGKYQEKFFALKLNLSPKRRRFLSKL